MRPTETAATNEVIGQLFISPSTYRRPNASTSATNEPVIAAVRVPPSA